MAVRRRSLLLALVLGAALVVTVPSVLSENARGAETSKTIIGTVSDLIGDPISGADVTVEIWGQNWPIRDYFRYSQSTVTDHWGYYEVSFDSNQWDPHNSIVVIVTIGAAQETRIVEADEDVQQMIDMTVNPAIPEFGNPAIFAAVVAGCALTVAVLRTRRKK